MQPICLPFSDNDKEEYKFDNDGELLNVTVAGWGATDPRGKNSYIILVQRLYRFNQRML